ncbi:hypothetical protein [Parasitella parasitica]|uniref:Reverse transcriptase domain-containing protein n=1 Tax=Parasitella parasitica TaxID=35722 RepID=A0A0B7MQ21_9FUNG|nr:hypothetical protein [Parasitella parasitica]
MAIFEKVCILRDFKQGDPISCKCYDLAFKPFLQSILQDQDFHGYQFTQHTTTGEPASLTTKILCYADDALVFTHDKQDLRLLKYYMDLFCRASNAQFNYSKVDAFSLFGRNTRGFWKSSLSNMKINHLHTADDAQPLNDLGFNLIQSTQQRIYSVTTLIASLKFTLADYFQFLGKPLSLTP